METPLKLAAKLLKLHEGLRLLPYTDSVGKLTIGYGHNLSDRAISPEVATVMFDEDLSLAFQDALYFVTKDSDPSNKTWIKLGYPRQAVLIDIAFNLGLPRLNGFKRMLAALLIADYESAADEMLDSRWAEQVGLRAQRLAAIMRSGQMPVL